jgi:glycosyltransferase involved in cell wall biosynthesis
MIFPGRVSVVLPIFNGERYLAQAIESVLAQTYSNYEILAVNDGSKDSSGEIAQAYLHTNKIRYLEQVNAGVANARNTAIANASGEFIAFLDQDDLWAPDKLANQVAYLASNPDVALVHCRVACIDHSGARISCAGLVHVGETSGYCAEQLLTGNHIAVLTVVVRRCCLEQVGFLNQHYAPSDDWDLWLRIALRYPLGFLDAELAKYRVHDSNESKNILRMRLAEIRVMESFRSTHPSQVRRMRKKPVDRTMIFLYEEAARLLARNGRAAESSTLLNKSARIKRWALWYYMERLLLVCPKRFRRYAEWYLQKMHC